MLEVAGYSPVMTFEVEPYQELNSFIFKHKIKTSNHFESGKLINYTQRAKCNGRSEKIKCYSNKNDLLKINNNN